MYEITSLSGVSLFKADEADDLAAAIKAAVSEGADLSGAIVVAGWKLVSC